MPHFLFFPPALIRKWIWPPVLSEDPQRSAGELKGEISADFPSFTHTLSVTVTVCVCVCIFMPSLNAQCVLY